MKHILIINQHYYPDFAATGQLLAELCEDLSEAGFKITVITGYPEPGTYPGGLNPEKTEISGNLKVFRIYNHPAGNKSILNRLLHFFSFWFGSILKSFRISQVDLVFVMSTPPLLNGITANLLRIFRRIPYVYNVQDLYPGIAVEMGTLKNKFIIRISEKLEQWINNQAISIVTLSGSMKNAIAVRESEREKIRVIPNWSDDSKLKPQPESRFRIENGLTGKIVVMYSGNIGMSQGLDKILSLAPWFEQNHPDVCFCLIGNGVNLPSIRQQIERYGCKNVRFFPFQPKETLSDSLNAADIHLVPLTEKMAGYLLPSKIYGILAVGKPVLAVVDPGSEIDLLIRNTGCGLSVQPGDPERIKTALTALLGEKQNLPGMGLKGYHYFLNGLTRKTAVSAYQDLFQQLSGR